jgi:hypothetical protein
MGCITAHGEYVGAQLSQPLPPNHWASAADAPQRIAAAVNPAARLDGQRNMGNFLFEVTRPKRDGMGVRRDKTLRAENLTRIRSRRRVCRRLTEFGQDRGSFCRPRQKTGMELHDLIALTAQFRRRFPVIGRVCLNGNRDGIRGFFCQQHELALSDGH